MSEFIVAVSWPIVALFAIGAALYALHREIKGEHSKRLAELETSAAATSKVLSAQASALERVASLEKAVEETKPVLEDMAARVGQLEVRFGL